MKRTWLLAFLLVLAIPSLSAAQTTPQNITAVVFNPSADHDTIARYDIEIVKMTDGIVIQTINGGKPAPDANNDIIITLNVQPITFARYVVRVRSVAVVDGQEIRGPQSEPSEVWERAPGAPSKPRVR